MSHNNSIIIPPVNVVSDIGYVVGVNSTDVGTLCTCDSLNMWSKKKPTDWHESTNIIARKCPQMEYPMRWYKGINQDFGITTGSYSNPLILYSAIDGGLNGWKYTKDSSYFRIMDFMDYYHNAKNPFSFFTFRLKSRLIEPSTTFSFTFRYVRNDYDSDHEMGISTVE